LASFVFDAAALEGVDSNVGRGRANDCADLDRPTHTQDDGDRRVALAGDIGSIALHGRRWCCVAVPRDSEVHVIKIGRASCRERV